MATSDLHRKNSFLDRIIGNKELLPDEMPMDGPLITQIAPCMAMPITLVVPP
jgi:hypothetical protein